LIPSIKKLFVMLGREEKEIKRGRTKEKRKGGKRNVRGCNLFLYLTLVDQQNPQNI